MIVYGIDHIPYDYPDDYAERCRRNVRLAAENAESPGHLALTHAQVAAADLPRLIPREYGFGSSRRTPRQDYEPPPQTLSEWEENVRKAREARTE